MPCERHPSSPHDPLERCDESEGTFQRIGDRDVWLHQRVACGPCMADERDQLRMQLAELISAHAEEGNGGATLALSIVAFISGLFGFALRGWLS